MVDAIQDKVHRPVKHYVYMLESEIKGDVCYIGYTNNPKRRIRQHNREISGHHAKYTANYQPWSIGFLVTGFHTDSEAQKFEWALQHPGKSKMLRTCGINMARKFKFRKLMFEYLLKMPRWSHITVVDHVTIV
jgi:structure-specific endonuclease subunit SLX1